MTDDLLRQIDAAYAPLEAKRAQLVRALSRGPDPVVSGWYNGHYRRTEDGGWHKEAYPIPVLTVRGLCDVEISFDGLSLSAKLARDRALSRSYDEFRSASFEVFGVEDYLLDFYRSGRPIGELKARVAQSAEREIGFAFSFPFDAQEPALLALASLLRRDGFYC